MWTSVDEEGLIPNCTVRRKYKDGVHMRNELHAHEGYAIHFISDNGYTDEETGEYFQPLYTYMIGLPITQDIYLYEAVLITPGMEVYEKPTDTEIM